MSNLKQDLNLKNINNSFEVIGKIAIIQNEIKKYDKIIAENILKKNKKIKTILKKTDKVQGEFRIPKLKYILGEKTFETEYKENGIVMKTNPNEIYFSSKLSTDRKNIFLNNKSKNILIMFCGVGPYNFVALKNNPNILRCDGVEINPKAKKYFLENKNLNKNILKKSEIYKKLIFYLRENKKFIDEKKLLKNLIDLKINFFNSNIRKVNFNLKKYECKKVKKFYDIQKLNFDKNLIFEIINNLEFTHIKFKKKYYFLNDIFSISFFFNFLEKKIFNLKIIYDEIFMPLPKNATDFLDTTLQIIKKNTKIFIYDFIEKKDIKTNPINKIKKFYELNNIKIKLLKNKIISPISSKKIRVCCVIKIL